MVYPADGSEDRIGTCGGSVAFHMPTSRGPHTFFTFATGDTFAFFPNRWAATAFIEKIA